MIYLKRGASINQNLRWPTHLPKLMLRKLTHQDLFQDLQGQFIEELTDLRVLEREAACKERTSEIGVTDSIARLHQTYTSTQKSLTKPLPSVFYSSLSALSFCIWVSRIISKLVVLQALAAQVKSLMRNYF